MAVEKADSMVLLRGNWRAEWKGKHLVRCSADLKAVSLAAMLVARWATRKAGRLECQKAEKREWLRAVLKAGCLAGC